MPLIGGFHQLLVVGLLDVVGPDLLEDVAEQVEAAVGIRSGGVGPIENVRLGADRDGRRAQRRTKQHKRDFAHHPRTF